MIEKTLRNSMPASPGKDVLVRGVTGSDLPAVFELYRRTVRFPPPDRVADYWHWKFEGNPCRSDAPPLWGAWQDGRLAGGIGQVPIVLDIQTRAVPTAWAVDLMVDPDFQRQGLGTRLFDHYRRHNPVAISMGYPPGSKTSLVARAADLRGLPPIPYLFKPLTTRALTVDLPLAGVWGSTLARLSAPALRRIGRLRPPRVPALRVEEVSRFTEPFDELWTRVAAETAVSVRRDHRTMNWRYCDSPFYRYRALGAWDGEMLAGCIVFKVVHHEVFNFATIAEFIVPPDAVGVQEHLLERAMEEFQAAGVDIVKSLASLPPLVRLLQRAGFRPLGPGIDFVIGLGPSLDPALAAAALDPAAWYLTKGDCDLEMVPDFLSKIDFVPR